VEERSLKVFFKNGNYAIVDEKDFEKISKYKWNENSSPKSKKIYARNSKVGYMHRLIMDAKKENKIDHINGNGLDNRKNNLRLATHQQNNFNKTPYTNNKIGYKGVRKDGNRYIATITYNGKTEYISSRLTPEEAAKDYDKKALAYFGEFAYLNFPTPLISIIVPTYNRNNFLIKCIESILNSIYINFEIIVVQDGGREEAKEVVDLFNDKRIKLFIKENGGLASARNHGIKNSQGKYISFIDSDDGIYPTFLESMIDLLENKKSEFKIVYCDSVRIHQRKNNDGQYENFWRDIPYSHDFNKDLLLVMNISPVNCFMINRECFNNVPPFDETVKVYEDYLMNLELSLKYDFYHYPVPLVWHTWREDGSTMSSSRDFTTPLPEIYKKYFQYAKNQIWVAEAMNNVLTQRGLKPLFKIQYCEYETKEEQE